MADLKGLSDDVLDKKIRGAKLTIERTEGVIKAASEKKLAKLEAELDRRKGTDAKKAEESAKKTVEETKAKKEAEKKEEKKEEKKKPIAKKEEKKEEKKPASPRKKKTQPTQEFELVIDGKTYKFDNLKSKQECEKAMKAVKARYAEHKEHKEARAKGAAAARTIPVTRRITDSFASVAKKAVSEVPKTKIDKKPDEIKKELDAVEKAFTALFDKLEALMDRKIPKTQRKAVMDILSNFESKVEDGETKKSKATAKKKEEGGLADSSFDNDWSYASLMD